MLRLSACGSRQPPESLPPAPGGYSSHHDNRDNNRAACLTAAQDVSAAGAHAAAACPGPDGGAAGGGLSGVFRRLRLPIMRRADGDRASAAIPGTGGRASALARSGRCVAAGLLLGFAALLALPLQAQAQTVVELVSNMSQSPNITTSMDVGGDNNILRAQKFSLPQGPNYIVSDVTIRVQSRGTDGIVVTIREGFGTNPGAILYTLNAPASLGTGQQTYTAPAGALLEADKAYFVMLAREQSSGDASTIVATRSSNQTGLEDWAIADTSRQKINNWISVDRPIRIQIKGRVASTDATLSGLALEDRHGSAIALTPATFNPNRSNYTAAVFNRTASVKLTATTTASAATVAIENDTDTSTPNKAELGLAVGSNTLRVTVTAEDNVTTKTYRLVTTRGSPSTCAAPDLAGRKLLWTGTLTIDVSKFFGTPVEYGFMTDANRGRLSDSDFDVETNSHTIDRVNVGTGNLPTVIAAEELWFSLTGALTAEEKATLSLHVCNAAFAFSNATYRNTVTTDSDRTYSWTGTGFDWAPITTRMLYLSVPASTDATLSGLVLEDASDDSGISLTPSPFVATTTSYAASVANAVDEITIKPAVNESNATFKFLNASDTELTDADTVQDEFQVALTEGANTIKVKVTAQDTTTTDT